MKSALVFRLASALILTALIALGAVLLPVGSQAQAAPPQLTPMKLFMMEGMSLEPLRSQVADEFQAVTIPDGFVRDGLRGFGIIPLGHTYWKPVGTWYSQSVRQRINLGGQMEVGVWCTNTERSVSSDFIFQLMKDDSVLLQASVSGARINSGQDTLVIARASFPPGNDTTIDPGSVISLYIQARCNGGATLKFGSSSLDSGFSFDSNSLSIHDVRITRQNVILEYKDAFMAPWTKIYTQILVNKLIVPNEKLTSLSNSLNLSREIYWERENRIGQDIEVFVTIGYSPELNISTTKILKLVHSKVQVDLTSIAFTILKVVVMLGIIVVGGVLLSILNKRKWNKRFQRLSEDKREGSYKEKKTAWRAMRNMRKEARKDRVRSRKVSPEPVEKEGFGLFKRTSKRPADRKDKAVPIPSAGDLEL
ncbi:MAG: hypothetical protein MUC62_07615 [Candidatus Thermoplasmatota archaeon]|jgi:hypothetical protein|nr:hypothetical protein [Candidatus Thermoplasmatota archaeon]